MKNKELYHIISLAFNELHKLDLTKNQTYASVNVHYKSDYFDTFQTTTYFMEFQKVVIDSDNTIWKLNSEWSSLSVIG